MQRYPNYFFIFILVTLFGCSGLTKDATIKNYYDLESTPLSNQKKTFEGDALLVKAFSISSGFDSHGFIYRIKKETYQADFYNEFITFPAKIITEIFTEALCSTEYFSAPVNRNRKTVNYRLSGKILALYGDYQIPATPKSVMKIRVILEKKEDNTFIPWFTRTYQSNHPILFPDPEHLVEGWNQGLKDILERLLTDYAAQK